MECNKYYSSDMYKFNGEGKHGKMFIKKIK